MDQQSPKQLTTAHFMHWWSVPSAIRPRQRSTQFQLAIIEFPPRDDRRSYRYATNGAGDYVMREGEGAYRQELYCTTTRKADWAIELLEGIALYPNHYLTRVGTFDTISAGGPIDQNRSPFTGVMIAPPAPVEGEEFGALERAEGEFAIVNQVVGLYDTEIDYCISHGAESLWIELAQADGELALDRARTRLR